MKKNIDFIFNSIYSYTTPLLFSVFLTSFLISGQFVYAGEKSLIKGCLVDCHRDFTENSIKVNVHDPVKKGSCVVCHNPHTSSYKGLLERREEKLCFFCHKKSDNEKFNRPHVHQPVKKGKCIVCHDPHYSEYKYLLTEKISDICFKCHEKRSILSGKIIHQPVKKGKCIVCHDPHSSFVSGLVKENEAGGLCVECHNNKEIPFINAHFNYSVGKSACTSCHNPHSSDKVNLLRAFIHKPVLEKCTDCHNSAESDAPLALKNRGTKLCYKCHEKIRTDFEKINSHQIGNIENMCLNCHDPHASDSKALLGRKEDMVCFSCHSDTEDRINAEGITHRHSKLENCSSCHSPHGSDYTMFLKNREDSFCTSDACHPNAESFSHPVGKGIVDPRNNKEVNCISCHDPMGSRFKNILRLAPEKELCDACHKM